MSHWQKGELKLDCSLAVLTRALINIMPEWEQHIKTDEKGGLTIHNRWQGDLKGFSVSVSLPSSDIGFKLKKDGTWEINWDSYSLPDKVRDVAGAMTQEVGAMMTRGVAAVNGFEITRDTEIGDERVIDYLQPIDYQVEQGY